MDPLLEMLARETWRAESPHVTKETIVLRLLKDVCEHSFRVPWSCVVDTLRQGVCLLDPALHRTLAALKEKFGGEDDLFDRLLGRDHVKASDLTKLANAVSNRMAGALKDDVEFGRAACSFFAADGFRGETEMKRYVDHFRWDPAVAAHVSAVRKLYEERLATTPCGVREIVERALACAVRDGCECDTTCDDDTTCRLYRSVVGEYVCDVAALKEKEATEECKKRRVEGDEGKKPTAKKPKTVAKTVRTALPAVLTTVENKSFEEKFDDE